MKVPGIEEMVRTYWSSKHLASDVSWDEMVARSDARSKRIVSEIRAGLLAVFETHVGPMIDAAVAFGLKLDDGQEACEIVEARRLYRERILSQLKEPRHD